jgi:hypothetical protein
MGSSERPRLRFTFVHEDVSAVAELDRDGAPGTVAGILAALPFEGEAAHAVYSGSEVAFFIPPEVWLPTENATSRVLPGDLGYYRFRGGEHYGWPDDVAELCWFYDRDATPSMPDGPVRVNVFGRFTEGWEAFAATCRAMRREGAKLLRVEDAGSPSQDEP